jgi:CBS domain-containing protein
MAHLTDPGLLVALLLLAALAGGYAAVLLRVPRVVGYLVGGLCLHYLLQAYLGGGIGAHQPDCPLLAAADQLHGVKTLALGLIMFAIGGVFEIRHLKAVGPRVIRLSVAKLVGVLVLVGLGCGLLASLTGALSGKSSLAFGLLLGTIGIATAPAATLFVLREYEAKGANSDAILTLTAINNVVCIILFHVLFLLLSSTRLIDSGYGVGRWIWLNLTFTSLGSIALGLLLGFVFSILYAKITVADFLLIFLGVALILGVFSVVLSELLHLSFNFLLVYLVFGATFANITPDQEAFHGALRTISGPIFALFFVLAGFEFHIQDLAHLGLVGAGYVVLRTAGKSLGGWLGTRWAHAPGEFHRCIGFGMLCQAGVAIGLASFLYRSWGTQTSTGFVPSAGAEALNTIVLGSVILFELFGPIALKRVTVAAGEVKAVTLLRRRRTPSNEAGSVTRRTWEALLRTLSYGHWRRVPQQKPLEVRHIMRSNIKVVPTSARFDEVLHFVEGSRYNHFPVVDDAGQYVGMIHFGDLRHIMYDPILRDLVTAHDLCRPDTPLATPELPLDELFELFHSADVGCLAVVDDEENLAVVGIVEQRDLLPVLHRRETANST